MARKHKVSFEPAGKIVEADENENLFFLAQRCGIHIDSSCGGQGSCHLCRISIDEHPEHSAANLRLTKDTPLEVFQRDENGKKYYLACRGHVFGDLQIRSEPRNQLTSQGHKPSLIGCPLLSDTSNEPGHILVYVASQRVLRAYLISREHNSVVAIESIVAESGERRHHFDLDDAKALLSQLSEHAPRLTRIVTFGQLRESSITAKDLGLPQNIELLSLADDSNTLRNLLAEGSGIATSDTTQILLSLRGGGWLLIGNRESNDLVPLGLNHLFDGVGLQHGMPAAPGAIDSLQILPMQARILLTTIGEESPVGISILGYLDTLAQLKEVGLIDSSGHLADSRTSVTHNDGSKAIVLVGPNLPAMSPEGVIYTSDESISLGEKDYRVLDNALEKIRTSMKQAIEDYGVSPEQLLVDFPGEGQLNPHTLEQLTLLDGIDSEHIIPLGDCLGLALARQALLNR